MPTGNRKHKEKLYAVLCRGEPGAPVDEFITGTYEEVLHEAGRFWESYDGKFTPTNPPETQFESGDGYEPEDTFTCLDPDDNTKIYTVTFDGGPEFEILPVKYAHKIKKPAQKRKPAVAIKAAKYPLRTRFPKWAEEK